MIIKTIKLGNSIMLTVPKEFYVPTGVEVEAKLVEPKKEFFDFSADVLADIFSDGYSKHEILKEFRNRKKALTSAFRTIAEDTVTNSKPMTKDELAAEISL